MVHRRPRYIVGYGPRVKGYCPGSPICSNGVSATSSGVYTRLRGSPETERYSDRPSGWRSRTSRSSWASQSRRWAAMRSMALGSNMARSFIFAVGAPSRPAVGVRTPGGVPRRVLGPDEQLVHRLPAGDDDPELAAKAVSGPQRVLDGIRVDVFAPDDEHVVEASIEPLRQPRVRAPARARRVRPAGQVAGHQPGHRLGGTPEGRVHRRALLPVGHRLEVLGGADLRVDDVLPEMHARPVSALAVGHPGHASRSEE